VKDSKQKELLKDEEVAQGWEKHKERMRTFSSLITNGSLFNLQSPDVGGQEGMTSQHYLLRGYSLASDDAYVAPYYRTSLCWHLVRSDIRRYLLSNTRVDHLIAF